MILCLHVSVLATENAMTHPVPLSTYVTPELKTALDQRAAEDGKSIRNVIEAALASYLASKDDSPPVKRLSGVSEADALEHGLHVLTWLEANGLLLVAVTIAGTTDYNVEHDNAVVTRIEVSPHSPCLDVYVLIDFGGSET